MLTKTSFILLEFLLLGLLPCHAQTMIAGADVATGIGGSLTYVVGKTVYAKSVGDTGTMTPTFSELPYLRIVTSTNEKDERLELSVFPNPTSHSVNLKFDQIKAGLSYVLSLVDGRVISKGTINSESMSISLRSYQGPYFLLNIVNEGRVLKRFKIIKQ